MWFSRQSRSVRVWFQAVTNSGFLRTGLPTNSFYVAVIDSNDTTNVVPTVSESVQRPGNYYFDVPSQFLIDNGVGDYNISIEINSKAANAGAPGIVTALSDVLQVSQFDFDTLSGSIWSARGTQSNVSGSMGGLLNMAAGTSTNITASVDVGSIVSGVWDAAASAFQVPGTMGGYQNMLPVISSTVTFTQNIENGTWIINGPIMTMYTSGTNIEIARFNLQDINGIAIDPSTQTPFRRIRI